MVGAISIPSIFRPLARYKDAAMTDTTPPSPASLWLEDALTGWILPVSGLALAAAAWGAYVLGLLPEGPAAAALALVVALVLALLAIRPALGAAVDRLTRGLALGAAALAALVCVLAAGGATWPGAPVAAGSLARAGDALPLPAGLSGRVKLLVHAPLPPGGTPRADFRLSGAAAPLEGQVERTITSARVGRGGRANIAHDLNEAWVHGAVAAGTPALVLERLSGQVAGPLEVSLYRELLPPFALWLLGAVALAAAAVAESRLRKGNAAALCGMALAYGLLVAANATPSQAIGTSLGAVLLGGLGGALAGGLAALVARLGPWRLDQAEVEEARLEAGAAAEAPSGAARRRRRRKA
jgi:hypothetical protein